MGFYIKDLYVHRIPKIPWRDPLTNPPTIPETSPILQAAVLSPHVGQVAHVGGGGGGGNQLPADDTTLWTIPTPITPIVTPGRLELNDLQVVRDHLEMTLKAVDAQLETMQPSAEELAYVQSVVKG